CSCRLIEGLLAPLANQPQYMMVLDRFDRVGQHDEVAVNLVQFARAEVETQLLAAQTERMPPGVLTQDQARAGNPHRLWCHDLISQGVLDHPILMNARFMVKSVAANDGLDRKSTRLN